MDFCTQQFGKPLHELQIEDIERYFENERTESDLIEFKSINSRATVNESLKKIQRTVAALLNSSGGIIILGAPAGKQEATSKIFKGTITFFNEKLDKDFINSKIVDSIIPLPISVKAHPIYKDDKTLLVFEVQESEYAPHQFDNTYYMRIDGQTKHAPHHYIEALFKKIKFPKIEAYLIPSKIEDDFRNIRITFKILIFNWSPLQNEENLSFYLSTNCQFEYHEKELEKGIVGDSGKELNFKKFKEILSFGDSIFFERVLIIPSSYFNNSKYVFIDIKFHGKYSPMKYSNYNIPTTDYNILKTETIFNDKYENILFIDYVNSNSLTKNQIIEIYQKVKL